MTHPAPIPVQDPAGFSRGRRLLVSDDREVSTLLSTSRLPTQLRSTASRLTMLLTLPLLDSTVHSSALVGGCTPWVVPRDAAALHIILLGITSLCAATPLTLTQRSAHPFMGGRTPWVTKDYRRGAALRNSSHRYASQLGASHLTSPHFTSTQRVRSSLQRWPATLGCIYQGPIVAPSLHAAPVIASQLYTPPVHAHHLNATSRFAPCVTSTQRVCRSASPLVDSNLELLLPRIPRRIASHRFSAPVSAQRHSITDARLPSTQRVRVFWPQRARQPWVTKDASTRRITLHRSA
jgi:hypothetical protein